MAFRTTVEAWKRPKTSLFHILVKPWRDG